MVWHPPGRDDEARQLLDDVVAALRSRFDDEQPDLGRALTYDQLRSALGTSITASGLGGAEALRRFEEDRIDDLIVVDRRGRPVGLVDSQDLPKLKLV